MRALRISFNEAEYLKLNPDVDAAVARGEIPSGWLHFVFYGIDESRPGSPEVTNDALRDFLQTKSTKHPVPPDHLRVRVHGSVPPTSFMQMGKIIALDIYTGLEQVSPDIGPAPRILDFGCGCGRVSTWFKLLYPSSTLVGTDIDPEAIRWDTDNLASVGSFGVNPYSPPMEYKSESFDLVFSISIFTHLPETMQFEWLSELRRVTRKGGYLALTVHPAYLLYAAAGAADDAKAELKQNGFYYQKSTGTAGLPDFYQTAYHSEDYIRRRWGEFFEILAIIPKGAANHQDMVMCRSK
jgi:SAM-dependent methyltransferase